MNSAEKSQSEKFEDAARDLQTDDSEENFDRTLKRLASVKPLPKDANSKESPK
jgi:hypothetical protein